MNARAFFQRLLLVAGMAAASGCGREEPRFPEISPLLAASSSSPSFVVLGDTQRTAWFEPREQNETARLQIMNRVLAERPAFVVHLGDMVTFGSQPSEWLYFDRLFAEIVGQRIPIYPVLGNHDYWGLDGGALKLARQRFPMFEEATFYARHHQRLGLIFLDSNLSGRAASRQRDWLHQTLHDFETDETIDAIVAFAHHPPYTLGKGRDPDPYVQNVLLPVIEGAPKAVLLMTGHVHGYERFQVGYRTFLVSGGAGGPRVEYSATRPGVPPAAGLPGTLGKRPFHYVRITPRPASLDVVVRCLPGEGCRQDGTIDSFEVPYFDAGKRAP